MFFLSSLPRLFVHALVFLRELFLVGVSRDDTSSRQKKRRKEKYCVYIYIWDVFLYQVFSAVSLDIYTRRVRISLSYFFKLVFLFSSGESFCFSLQRRKSTRLSTFPLLHVPGMRIRIVKFSKSDLNA